MNEYMRSERGMLITYQLEMLGYDKEVAEEAGLRYADATDEEIMEFMEEIKEIFIEEESRKVYEKMNENLEQ